jgi:hypothetical protein
MRLTFKSKVGKDINKALKMAYGWLDNWYTEDRGSTLKGAVNRK